MPLPICCFNLSLDFVNVLSIKGVQRLKRIKQVCQFYIALHDITCMYILYVLFKKAKLRKIYTNIPSELRKPHPEEELCLTRRRRFQPCLSSHQNLPRSAKSPSVWKRVVNSAVPSLAYWCVLMRIDACLGVLKKKGVSLRGFQLAALVVWKWHPQRLRTLAGSLAKTFPVLARGETPWFCFVTWFSLFGVHSDS